MLFFKITSYIFQKELPFKVGGFIGLLKFEWHNQNEVGNVVT